MLITNIILYIFSTTSEFWSHIFYYIYFYLKMMIYNFNTLLIVDELDDLKIRAISYFKDMLTMNKRNQDLIRHWREWAIIHKNCPTTEQNRHRIVQFLNLNSLISSDFFLIKNRKTVDYISVLNKQSRKEDFAANQIVLKSKCFGFPKLSILEIHPL